MVINKHSLRFTCKPQSYRTGTFFRLTGVVCSLHLSQTVLFRLGLDSWPPPLQIDTTSRSNQNWLSEMTEFRPHNALSWCGVIVKPLMETVVLFCLGWPVETTELCRLILQQLVWTWQEASTVLRHRVQWDVTREATSACRRTAGRRRRIWVVVLRF